MSKAFFATAQDAEAAFYEALERANLEAMMLVWADDEEIVCIHPGGPRLSGNAAVREAWQQIFSGGSRLRVQVTTISFVANPFTAIHSVIEYVGIKEDPSQQAPVVATNIYIRGAAGWHMVVHHASPAPPDSVTESPKVLH